MRQLPPFPESYWQKFSENPVNFSPYKPQTKEVAQEILQELQNLLHSFSIQDWYHRGSTALEISGKGDIEVGIIPSVGSWFPTIVFLANHFGGIGNLDDEYARFNMERGEFEIEIILMRGYTALLDKKLHDYLREHPNLLSEYEQIKQDYRFSERLYNLEKDRFFRKVISLIPDTV